MVAKASRVVAGVGRERISLRDILQLLINEMLVAGGYKVDS